MLCTRSGGGNKLLSIVGSFKYLRYAGDIHVLFLIGHLYLNGCLIKCQSKDIHHDKDTLLKGNWARSPISINYSTSSSQHNWGRKCYVFIEEINTHGLSIIMTTLRGD